MIEVQITDRQKQLAQERLEKFHFDAGKGLSKFGSEKGRTLYGYVGEQIVLDFFGIPSPNDESYEFDLLYKGKRLEVKSISCKFRPLPHYLCTVNSFDLGGVHRQEADYYIFVRIINDLSKAWMLGFMPCKEFFEKGIFVAKGSEVVPGLEFKKANATVLPISKLSPIESFLSL